MKTHTLLFFLFICISLGAQHSGINILNPEYSFDVQSTNSNNPGQLNISNQDKSRYVRFFSGSETFPDPSMSWAPSHSLLFATFDDNTFDFTEYMRISAAGNVGIGVTDPQAQLDLKGGDWNLNAGNPGDLRIGSATNNFRIGVDTGGGGAGITRLFSSNHLKFGTDSTEVMHIDKAGNTGFDTNNPGQKVEINGKLKIGDDDAPPTEGTIRFNDVNKSFEGYDGTKWISLGGSSPYGNQGTFNIPNTSFFLSFPGSKRSFDAIDGWIAVRSEEQVVIGNQPFFPFDPIFGALIHISLFKEQTNGTWSKVLSLDSDEFDSNDRFALSFTLTNSRLLVGDPKNQSVYEYTMQAGFWLPSNTFTSPDANVNDQFGASIGVTGSSTIIGAPARISFPLNNNYGPGKAYIYDGLDNLAATLQGPGPVNGDGFGTSVGLFTNRAIVGAPYDDFGSTQNAGSATVFNKFNGNWSPNNTFFNATVEEDENYGYVKIVDDDYFYISGNNGIDAYLVENGFWVVKETLEAEDPAYFISGFTTEGIEKVAFRNLSFDSKKLVYISTLERDANEIFINSSSLIIGDDVIYAFDLTSTAIYILGRDDFFHVFEL